MKVDGDWLLKKFSEAKDEFDWVKDGRCYLFSSPRNSAFKKAEEGKKCRNRKRPEL